jgi:MFS transporter, DHA1 family, solute carrier family 18 (vesicular amine transporter), member 1/2
VTGSRRITLAVGVLMFVDAALYLAVIPLLPHYVDRFGLSTFEAGVVIAAYPISVPLVSLGCIVLVPRVGARRITLASAALMSLATVIFAWAPSAAVLIAARLVQGFASGSIWTGSMSWVTDNAPEGRRGRESGIVMGMLSAGSIAGPAVGAIAAWAGQGPAFGLVAAVSLLGVALAALAPAGRAQAGAPARLGDALGRAIRQPATRAALALTLVDLLTFGAVDLLVPLRLGVTGTSVAAIAAAIGAGAVLGAITGPIGGRLVDRIGPQQVGLTAAACIVVIPVVLAFEPTTGVQLGSLVIGGPLFALVGSAIFPLSSAGADAAGVPHVAAMGLMGVVWAAGFTVVPLAVGALAQSTSRTVAYLVIFALTVPVLVMLRRAGGALGQTAEPRISAFSDSGGIP